jgi:hypothetical protein
VRTKLPLLTTYMGHVSIVSTSYYLAFVEPLRTAASARFARHYGGLVQRAAIAVSRYGREREHARRRLTSSPCVPVVGSRHS